MRYLPLLLFLVGCSGALHVENDIFGSLKTEDKYYTNGTQFSYFKETENKKETYSIGQLIFTPSRKKADAPIEELEKDRPYGGWLYGEYRNTKYTTETQKDTWGVQLGCSGGCSYAKQTQQHTHEILGQTVPTWNPDFSLRAEPGVILERERSYRIAKGTYSDASIYGAGKVGNIVDSAAIGLDGRLGFNLDKFSLEPIIFKIPKKAPSNWKAYLFSRLEGRYVPYNHMLEGSLFQSENHTVTPERLVGEFDVGFTVAYKKASFTYRFSKFSSEWEERPGTVNFGGLTFGW